MRILVAIANYGTGNRDHLERLVSEYHAMPWSVDIVVLSNIPKALGPKVEVRVGLPDKNPWSLPFAHRSLFYERRNDYDLFIYSEDDTLVRASNIEAFCAAADVLNPDEIAGFMRTETDAAKNVYVSSVHGFFRWDSANIINRGGTLFARFTNDHAACYMVTRDQLAAAIASGGFVVAPYEGRYDMLCTAATDVYTRCGMKRYICLSRLGDFLLSHLPNKYIGKMGIPLREVEAQVQALTDIAATEGWRGPLFDVETRWRRGEWSKDLYERLDPDLLQLIPPTTQRLLAVGSGWGETEAALAARGIAVTAIPIDPVFGDALRRRGVHTVDGPLTEAVRSLASDRFDCVLLRDVLHLVDDPTTWLTTLRSALKVGSGTVTLSVPHTRDIIERLRMMSTSAPPWRNADGQPSFGVAHVRGWLRAAGFSDVCVYPVLGPKREKAVRATLGMLRGVLAQRLLATATAR